MVIKNINDEIKWSSFVDKIIRKTTNNELEWKIIRNRSRDRINGPLYICNLMEEKYVAVFSYSYDHYFDVDEYETRTDVAIELVDSNGEKLWRLPEVAPRHALLDLIEFKEADAENLLNNFLYDDEDSTG